MLPTAAPFQNVESTNGQANGAYRVIEIPSDTSRTEFVQQQVEQALRDRCFGEDDLFAVRLALEEALVNAIKHGNQLDRAKKVAVAYRVDNEAVEIHVRDEGRGFNPDDLPDPLVPENLERCCGRGLLLMRHYMTAVIVQPPGNVISLFRGRSRRGGR